MPFLSTALTDNSLMLITSMLICDLKLKLIARQAVQDPCAVEAYILHLHMSVYTFIELIDTWLLRTHIGNADRQVFHCACSVHSMALYA